MLSVLLMAPALVTPPRASSAVWRERMRAQRHIRPHVNPLQRRFQLPAALDLEDLAFAQSQPIHVDVGCGKGHFCADLAEARPDLNVLGIEIRDPLVEEANRLCQLSGTGNLRFVAGSANVLLGPCCDALGMDAPLASCSIQFPDPWFKRRYAKRRVVQPELVAEIGRRLQPRGLVFLQSDIAELAAEMRGCFLGSGLFDVASATDLAARPFGGVQTERERQCARRELPVFRALLRRTDAAAAEDGEGGAPSVPAPAQPKTALVNTLHASLRGGSEVSGDHTKTVY